MLLQGDGERRRAHERRHAERDHSAACDAQGAVIDGEERADLAGERRAEQRRLRAAGLGEHREGHAEPRESRRLDTHQHAHCGQPGERPVAERLERAQRVFPVLRLIPGPRPAVEGRPQDAWRDHRDARQHVPVRAWRGAARHYSVFICALRVSSAAPRAA